MYLSTYLSTQKSTALLFLLGIAPGLSSCMKPPAFLGDSTASIQHTGLVAPIQFDQQGVLSANISATSGKDQVVAASKGSNISTARVNFPAGALALDTTITVEEGASLAGSSFTSELGAKDGLQVASAGAAVAITSSVPMDATSPFTLAIPISASSGLRLASPDLSMVVVIYKVYKEAEGKIVVGVIPRNEITIEGDVLTFATVHFGVYQAGIADRPVEKKIEATTTAPILTKAAEEKLADIIWKPVSVKYDANTRKLSASTSAANLKPLRCSAFYDSDKTQPYDRVEELGTGLAVDLVVARDVGGTYYVAFECQDQSGRTSLSEWSDAIAIKALPLDIAPPVVTSTNPVHGATNIARNVIPTMTFSKEIAASSVVAGMFNLQRGIPQGTSTADASINPGNLGVVALTSGGPVVDFFSTNSTALNIGGTFQASGQSGSFTPSKQLPLATTLTASLAGGLRDNLGNVMKPYSWSFTTRDGNWLSNAPTIFSIPTTERWTAKGPNGSFLLVYRDTCNGMSCYVVRYSRDGREWAMNGTTLMQVTDYFSVTPFIDGEGNATVVLSMGPTFHVFQLLNNASSWPVTPKTYDTNAANAGTYEVRGVFPASAGAGAFDLILRLWNGTTYEVSALRFEKGNWLSTPTPITATNSYDLTYFSNSLGAIAITREYCSDDSAFSCVFASTSKNGKVWSARSQVMRFYGSSATILPSITPDGSFNMIAIPSYAQLDSNYKAFANRMVANATNWASSPATISFGSNPTYYQYMNADESGFTLLMRSYNYTTSSYDMSSLRFQNGTWKTPVPILNSISYDYWYAGGPNDSAVLVLRNNCIDSAETCIMATYKRNNGPWSNVTEIARFQGYVNAVIPVIDSSGNITVFMAPGTFQQNGNYVLLASRLPSYTTAWQQPPATILSSTSNIELRAVTTNESGQLGAVAFEYNGSMYQLRIARFD